MNRQAIIEECEFVVITIQRSPAVDVFIRTGVQVSAETSSSSCEAVNEAETFSCRNFIACGRLYLAFESQIRIPRVICQVRDEFRKENRA